MSDVHVTIWDENGGPTVVLVHGVLTWGSDPAYGFGMQRPLGKRYRVLAMDRRGYGKSPDIEHSDYRVDAQDIAELLGDGAHLVGHSYGGVAAMVAAAARPEAVRSLALIQPGCLQIAADDPNMASVLRSNREALAKLPTDVPVDVYLKASTESVGLPPLAPTPERLRAAATTMRERPCWEGDLPVAQLAAAPWPKLVISGTWKDAPRLHHRLAGAPLMTCARITAERIHARLIHIPGYYPHVQHPDLVNSTLAEFWTA